MQPSLYISTPTHLGNVNIHYAISLFQTQQHLIANKIPYQWDVVVGAGIDSARCKQATNFLNSGFSHMLMIDDDMAWAPDLPMRMMRENLDVLAVPYRKKSADVVYNLRHTDKVTRNPDRPHLFVVDHIATGMMMVRRQVFEALTHHVPLVRHSKEEPPVHLFFRHDIIKQDGEEYPMIQSEDYYFCDLVKKIGGEIVAYADEDVPHIGPYAYRGSYGEQLAKDGSAGVTFSGEREQVKILYR